MQQPMRYHNPVRVWERNPNTGLWTSRPWHSAAEIREYCRETGAQYNQFSDINRRQS
jgi:hypothetical protein